MRGREMAQGTIAGRYRMLREVGRGGMGSVWLCRDERLGRQVAIKQVGHAGGATTRDLTRAMREARSSAPLNHPHVVAIYDAIDEGDRFWLVMEYVEGRSLADVIKEDGPVEPVRAAEIGVQVAAGLAAAHSRGTIHRDVKPSNILLGHDGGAKISDFGIARTMGDETLTETGFVTGTPSYLSPELARGEDPSPAADVWALGATLFAAVEGQPPYASQPNPLATLQAIVGQPPPRPKRAGVLAEPIGRMMDPDPRSRWDIADVAHALRRARLGERAEPTRNIPAPPAEPTPAPRRAPRRRPALLLVLAGLAVLVMLAGGGFLLANGPDSPDPDTSGQSGEPRGSNDAAKREKPTSAPRPAQPPAKQREDFVADYYAALPGDTQTGWSLLSPGFQQEVGSYASYDGFWSTIDSVTVEDARAVGGGAVDTTLVYTTDGSSQSEVRRIELTRSGDDFLISGDEVVG